MAQTGMTVVNNALSLERAPVFLGDQPARFRSVFTERSLNGCLISPYRTISSWIDFDSYWKASSISEHCYIFSGRASPPAPHERITYGGSVEHDLVFEIMGRSDALVMPFRSMARCKNGESGQALRILLYRHALSGGQIL